MKIRLRLIGPLLGLFLCCTAYQSGTSLIHCEQEPGGTAPCTDATSIPEIIISYSKAIGPNGDTVLRAEKLLYHILSGDMVGKSKTIEFKLYEFTAGEPVYKDQAIVNPESNWYSCWVMFSYFRSGKFRLVAIADGEPVAEDTFDIVLP